jgi:hypothetical protein
MDNTQSGGLCHATHWSCVGTENVQKSYNSHYRNIELFYLSLRRQTRPEEKMVDKNKINDD